MERKREAHAHRKIMEDEGRDRGSACVRACVCMPHVSSCWVAWVG